MRFKFDFVSLADRPISMPINYQYYLHSWFYKVLSMADKDFAGWLHDRGFSLKGYHYKMFCFSWLKFARDSYQVVGDKIILRPGVKGSLIFSFYLNEIAEKFIIGLFTDQKMIIRGSEFMIQKVQRLMDPQFKETMRYRALTPIKISLELDRDTPTYLSPDHPEYSRLMRDNLEKKLKSLGIDYDLDGSFDFRLLSSARAKLITIKQGTKDETRVRGFLYDFELTAPIDFHKVGYFAGFGESNSMGFGLVKVSSKSW